MSTIHRIYHVSAEMVEIASLAEKFHGVNYVEAVVRANFMEEISSVAKSLERTYVGLNSALLFLAYFEGQEYNFHFSIGPALQNKIDFFAIQARLTAFFRELVSDEIDSVYFDYNFGDEYKIHVYADLFFAKARQILERALKGVKILS
ncbi:MAG: hypothetical protein LBO66_06010 [Deltaproteobacteria bacterium]|nr:hypothetical protein [Deltaproteobacteria bacterium]